MSKIKKFIKAFRKIFKQPSLLNLILLDNKQKKKEFHGNLYHVANTMCAVFIRKNFETKIFESPKSPEILFEVNLRIEK